MTNSYSTQILQDEAATHAVASWLAARLQPGDVVYLQGDLGAGKTTLVRGLLHALGHTGKVKSPTYTLVEPYVLPQFILYHFDLYRFTDPEEWEAAGFREYFHADSLCLVEWPDKGQGCLPAPHWIIAIEIHKQGRRLHLQAPRPQEWTL